MKHIKLFENFQEDIDWDKEMVPFRDFDDRNKWEEYYRNYIEKVTRTEFKGGMKVADKHFSEDEMLNILQGYLSYYESFTESLWQLSDHLGTANIIWARGGELFRLIYANSEEEINKENLGNHWTISDYEIEGFRDRDWKGMYGGDKKYPFLVTIQTPPNNVSVKDVDIHGNPEEKEINILDDSKIIIKSIVKIKG